jgi:hypothetical protein
VDHRDARRLIPAAADIGRVDERIAPRRIGVRLGRVIHI